MLTQEKERELQNFAREIRIQTIRQIGIRGFGHIGGCMSIADLLSVLYGEDMKYRSPKSFLGGPGLVGLLQGPRGTGHLCGTGTERLFPDGVDGNVEPARDKFTQPL